MKLPKPECEVGYTDKQLREILGDRYETFKTWMAGQTMAVCNGKEWNPEEEKYEVACGGVAHGVIVYSWDLDRFLAGKKIID